MEMHKMKKHKMKCKDEMKKMKQKHDNGNKKSETSIMMFNI